MKKIISLNLINKKVAIISHIFVTGPSQALLEYLAQINKTGKVLFIGHPLFYQPEKDAGSYSELYIKGKKTETKKTKNLKLPSIVSYFKDIFLSIYWILKTREKWDVVICADNLNTLAGIILRKLGKVKKVIFYTVDYVPIRFENKILDEIYHLIDKFAVYNADEIWNLSGRMEQARAKYRKVRTKKGKQKIVPMGTWFKKIKIVPFEEMEKHTLVFMGHLVEKQGVQLIIQVIPGIIKKIPDFKFLIIGTGEYEKSLKKLAKSLKVKRYIKFTGYIANYEEVENMITKCACAVALYKPGDKKRNFTYYADPGKLKAYLGAGVPVILTNVPHNAKIIEKKKCGIIVDYKKEDIARAIIGLLKDENKLKTYRRNAVKYAKEFDWNKIFSRLTILSKH